MQVALHYKLCKPRQLHMNLSEVLRAHLELPHAILPGPINYAKAAGELRAFMTVTHLQPGSSLFKQVILCCMHHHDAGINLTWALYHNLCSHIG